ncbi:hypothetical protein DDZ13_05170 [Coraliomargarita sinensis]|uniref:FAD-binding domain-containing protein n=1 Tax=Coraliomargarita sinensis TaxID=2174842 RepID=A0A317ZKV4_9BACT|nr:hypothetical protein [Coraliomargarita sinensis]PXA04568.1 hypothetical protein DDZ13_05170 [Coraliomargarita sinensis]
MRPISIIGGGLAGLSLGIGLRRTGVPVTLTEAGQYPRHRVCGEFISGLSDQTIQRLGLARALSESVTLHRLQWYDAESLLRDDTLPAPAKGLSRWKLDESLADEFTELGGTLQTDSRSPRDAFNPGTVDCAGRRPRKESKWIGLKCHLQDFQLSADLEMHMSAQGYLGLSRIENGRTNLCGLFRNCGIKPPGNGAPFIFEYLRHCGFRRLLSRIEWATPIAGSECSVAALSYAAEAPIGGGLQLGDARGLIPPFTGNGMTLAFESAALALDPLRAFSRQEINWESCADSYTKSTRAHFGRRLTLARGLHRWLVSPALFPLTSAAARTPLFPFQSLFRLTR